jgi:hypothetical protein
MNTTKKFLMAVLTTVAGVTIGGTLPARAQEAVELFRDYNFSGEVLRLDSPGYHALPDYFNDRVSSIVVPNGYSITLYEDRNQAGRAVTLGSGRHNLDRFNDLASSVLIRRVAENPNVNEKPGVEFFSNYDFTGERLKVDTLGYYAMPSYFNDQVSSLIIPSGYEVTLYEGYNQAGRSIKLGAGRHNVSRFNDTISSVVIKQVSAENPTPIPGRREVQLFEDFDYRGDRLVVDRTGYFAIPRYFDNRLSSIVVPKGYEVTLYEHYNRGGRSILLRAGRHNLSGFNDTVSSLVVRDVQEASNPDDGTIPGRREVQFYEDFDYRGDRLVVDRTGYYAVPRYFTRRISSVIVPKGYEVTVYTGYNQSGNSMTLQPGRHNLHSFNDAVASAVIRRIGEDSGNPSNPSAERLRQRVERQFVGRRVEQAIAQIRFAGYQPSLDDRGRVVFNLVNLDGSYRVTLNHNPRTNIIESVEVR